MVLDSSDECTELDAPAISNPRTKDGRFSILESPSIDKSLALSDVASCRDVKPTMILPICEDYRCILDDSSSPVFPSKANMHATCSWDGANCLHLVQIDLTQDGNVVDKSLDCCSGFDCHAAGKVPEFNCHAAGKVPEFNCHTVGKVPEFNCHAAGKVLEFNCHAAGKVPEFNCHTVGKVPEFNCHAAVKVPEFNCHTVGKVPEFNCHTVGKVLEFNCHAAGKVPEFNCHTVGKVPEFNCHAAGKVPEFNCHAAGKVPEFIDLTELQELSEQDGWSETGTDSGIGDYEPRKREPPSLSRAGDEPASLIPDEPPVLSPSGGDRFDVPCSTYPPLVNVGYFTIDQYVAENKLPRR